MGRDRMSDGLQTPKISVVICYTNTEQLAEAEKYLRLQTMFSVTELVFLDNRDKRFPSAASALNYGADKALGEIVVFMHQDVYLWDTEFLEKYYDYLINNPNAIVGAAGVAKKDRKIYYDFCETKEHIYRGTSTNGELMQAVTLDECVFAMKKELWQKLKFDEKTCDNWHFYGADICYNNILNGGGYNIIYSADICHESKGSFNGRFGKSAKRMVKKYRGKIERLETTCIHINCGYIAYFVYFLKSKLYKPLSAIKRILFRKR